MTTTFKPAAVAHGGVGSDPAHADGCQAAVEVALATLATTSDALAAAVAGVVVLEDDPRFNAGTGSTVRLDGSIQMDASVMDSRGHFGAVAGIERVKNAVKVARAVLDTPHLLLVGDGATRFARALGHGDYNPSTDERRAATERIKRQLAAANPELPAFWRGGAWRARWNYPLSPEALGLSPRDGGNDTVGMAVRAPDGRFAAALSTGGMAVMLRGRVGDVPVFGAGLYAGAHGAAAATGVGERIVEALLAKTVYDWLAAGMSADEAARQAVALIGARASEAGSPQPQIGMIVVGQTGLAAAASHPMAWAGREENEPWQLPRTSA